MENQNNENIISRSIISVGKYEILYRSYPVKSETDSDIAIQYLNNARVVSGAQLRYEIIPSDTENSISCVKFTMPSDDNKLRACLKTIVNRSEFSESNYNSRHHEHFVG